MAGGSALGYGLPERETCCILPVNQLSCAYFLTKWKKCNIVSLFLQIHIVESTIPRRSSVPLSLQKGAAYGMLPICKAFVCLPFYKRLFHIPLQSPWGLHNPMSPGSYRPENDNTILTDLWIFWFTPTANILCGFSIYAQIDHLFFRAKLRYRGRFG